jgi:energy-converting hydrogenase B subunit D
MIDSRATLALALDLLLAAAIVIVAWRALTVDSAFVGIVLYITFGLLMALAWVRLAAPDIALAEAAIGAGLTGALLINAAARDARPGGDR